jgi:general secretion pathway protein G
MNNRKAFTMLELTFVIVIICILSAIAIPKFAMNRDDAVISKAKSTVAAVRNAITTEAQKRILKGKFDKIKQLSSATGFNKDIFDAFDGNTANPVLAYPLLSCKDSSAQGCWVVKTQGAGTSTNPTVYTYKMPVNGTVDFNLENNRFVCASPSDNNCKRLTR